MLIPVDANIQINSEIFGSISSALIEDYELLATITKGDQQEIREVLSKHLKKFFNQYLNKMQ